MLHAENAALAAGGTVLRLAGLYTLRRGAHIFYLKANTDIKTRADGLVNQIHYSDAATLAVSALLRGALPLLPRAVTRDAIGGAPHILDWWRALGGASSI